MFLKEDEVVLVADKVFRLVLSSLLLYFIGVSDAKSRGLTEFNIEQNSLVEALYQFAEQAGLLILFSPEILKGYQSPALSGNYSPERALELLLRDTSLESLSTGKTIIIRLSPESLRRNKSIGVVVNEFPLAMLVEEIVVTALKRATSIQDTPFSISALSGDALTKIGADDFEDYASKIPGLALLDNGPGSRRLVMRGVQGPGEAQVGLYIDEFPVTGAPGATSDAGLRPPDIKMSDIERVEVLRGPQGTLYGASAVGGALRVITNKPDVSGIAAKVSFDVSETESGGMGTQINGMVNIPIIEEELAVRLVAYDRDIDGFIDNVFYGQDNLNDEQTSGARVLVRWTPSDTFTLTGMYLRQETETDGSFSYNKEAGYLKSSKQTREPFEDEVRMANITSELDLVWANWVVSYSEYERDVVFSFDSTVFPFPPPFDRLTAVQPQPLEATSFETRLASDSKGPFNWIGGVYISKRDAELGSRVLAANTDGYALSPEEPFFVREDESSLKQKSIFGELYYELTDNLTATFGARFFDIEIDKEDTTTVGFFGQEIADPVPVISAYEETGNIFKLHLGYELNEDILLFGQVSEGFRPGGANQTVQGQMIPSSFDSDIVTNYEIGMRSTWLDGRLTFNASLYHLVWEGIQVAQRTADDLFFFLVNAGEAQVDGIELELSWLVTENLALGATLNAVNARLTENQPAVDIRAGLDDDEIPAVPELTASLAAQYTWPLESGLSIYARGDVSYIGASNNNYREFLIDIDSSSPTFGQETTTANDRFAEMAAYTLANLRFGIEADSWGADLYINNATNERGETYIVVDNFRPAPGDTYGVRPRTVGLKIYKNF